MTTLVTGATGFLGSAVARQLLDNGTAVAVLVRPGSPRANIDRLDVDVREGDLRDQASLDRALDGCTGLFHVAADYRLWTKNPNDLYANNVDGTRNLMLAALEKGVSRIVYTSSVATLGINQDGTASNEQTAVTFSNMVGHYKRSKFLAEKEVDKLIVDQQLPAVIVNPSTPVGPRDIKPTPTGRVIFDAARGRIPAYVDTGLNIAHVDDVAKGHLLAYASGRVGRRYILGGEDMSLKEILTVIADICAREPPRVRLPRGIVYPVAWFSELWASITDGPEPRATIDGLKMSRKKMFFSSARAISELGYQFRPATEAIRDAIEWFEQNEAVIGKS